MLFEKMICRIIVIILSMVMYNSKKYVLKSVEMEEADASGVYAKKATPYLVKERFFYGIRMTKIYVLSN